MKTANYNALKTKHGEEVNNFPMSFAFSNEQFATGLKKLGATREDVVSIGGGGFIRKTDKDAFLALFKRHTEEMEAAMLDDDFLTDAIRYELGNHEYCITGDETDTLETLGVVLDDERKVDCFNKARTDYLSNCEY